MLWLIKEKNMKENGNKVMKTIIKWTLVLILGIIMWVFVIPKPMNEYDRIEMEMLHEMEVHWDTINLFGIDLIGITQEKDTITNYEGFNDIPAGIHRDTIKVNGLIYKKDKEETMWVLINSEE